MPLAKPLLPLISPRATGRFWAKVARRSIDDCWLWQGDRTERGYGRFTIKLNNVSAHRFAWVLSNGVDPDPEHVIMHRCDVRHCVNPAHLCPGTHEENTLDSIRKGRRPSIQAGGTCRRGHEITDDTILTRVERGRIARGCRTCKREAGARRYAASKCASEKERTQ